LPFNRETWDICQNIRKKWALFRGALKLKNYFFFFFAAFFTAFFFAAIL
jgi:hypothetical protein